MQNPESYQLPPQLATHVPDVDALYNFIYWFSVAFTALITGFMLYFIVKYRRRPGVKSSPAGHNTVLEVAWTVLPLIFIVFLFHFGFKAYVKSAVAAEGAMEIRVMAAKWKWDFGYPSGRVEPSELTLPVGKPVKFIISSEDVLHSFYVPGARMKKDAVPGMYTSMSFTPSTIGTMQVFCAEYCGTSHSGMLATIKVVSPEDFEKFMKEGDNVEPTAEVGATLYKKNACNTCHSLDGSKMPGPTWKGIFGRQETMADGSTLTIDENYIKESIQKPQAKVVQGFQPVMPPYPNLTDKHIDAIIAYMKTLK
jgi:cytochrome c oxidase subunit 2